MFWSHFVHSIRMSAVFTIADTDFDDLEDDEEFLNAAFNFESNQSRNSVSCNNLEIRNLPTSNIGDKLPNRNSNGCSDKHNLLRSKVSSLKTSSNSGRSSGYLRPSSVNCLRSSNAKRIGNFNDSLSSEPPSKKQNYVKENRTPCLKNNQSFNFKEITAKSAIEHPKIVGKISTESNRLNNEISINKGLDARSNLSNGLRYIQNTTSAVSSPKLTNHETHASLAGPRTPLTSRTGSFNETETLVTNLYTPVTPSRHNELNFSKNLLGNATSRSINKHAPEFRFTKDSANELMESESKNDTISARNRIKSNFPITPSRYTFQNSSVDKSQNPPPASTSQRTPKRRTFAKDSPSFNLKTPLTEKRCVTPRRFPGPAGILPRLDPSQSMDNLQSPLLEFPGTKSPQLCQLVTYDDEDFTMEPWTLMQEKAAKDFPTSTNDTITSVIRKAASNELEKGKVSFLAVLIKSFDQTGLDVSVVLKDPSGEMRGTLHRKILEQQQVELGPGCGLFLKQVSVFSPSPRKHYLNITPGNILEVFAADAEQFSSQKVSETTPTSRRNEKEKLNLRSNSETLEVQSIVETNFDELLEGLDDDDDMLVEAMNI